ncbi:MAG TPA: hypothetical protein VII73_07440 [Caulobacteraceae bacterium]
MKATFQGDAAGEPTTVFGKTFAVGKEVDVSDLSPEAQAQLIEHPLFKTTGKAADPQPEPEPAVA